jgi:hypothetical protein
MHHLSVPPVVARKSWTTEEFRQCLRAERVPWNRWHLTTVSARCSHLAIVQAI